MNGTMQEAFTDILNRMRGRGEDGRVDAPLWRKYADELEAAYLRREKFWRGRVKDAIEVADQFKGALDHVLNGLMFANQTKKEA